MLIHNLQGRCVRGAIFVTLFNRLTSSQASVCTHIVLLMHYLPLVVALDEIEAVLLTTNAT
jgi:hypothetical protein